MIVEHEKPFDVKTHDVKMDSEYTKWISELKERYHKSQIKAAVKVNSEQLLFNWQLGRDWQSVKLRKSGEMVFVLCLSGRKGSGCCESDV